MDKVYKIRIYPDDNQKEFIHKTYMCFRMVYNHFLKRRTETWNKLHRNLSLYDCSAELTLLKQSEPYTILQDVDAIALQQALIELENDFQEFFKNPKKGYYPQFKKQDKGNYYITVRKANNIYFNNGCIKLPKMFPVQMEDGVKTPDSYYITSAKVVKEGTDKYYVFLYVEDEEDKEE